MKESIPVFLSCLWGHLLDFSGSRSQPPPQVIEADVRPPRALWLCWNGAVTSLASDTFARWRRRKPINNVNGGSDLFGCPREAAAAAAAAAASHHAHKLRPAGMEPLSPLLMCASCCDVWGKRVQRESRGFHTNKQTNKQTNAEISLWNKMQNDIFTCCEWIRAHGDLERGPERRGAGPGAAVDEFRCDSYCQYTHEKETQQSMDAAESFVSLQACIWQHCGRQQTGLMLLLGLTDDWKIAPIVLVFSKHVNHHDCFWIVLSYFCLRITKGDERRKISQLSRCWDL